MEKMSDQIKNNNMFPDLDPKSLNKERGRVHQNILMLFWYQHDLKVNLSPEFQYLISIMRAWESITSSSNGLLRLLTFNCRVSVCLRKISGVPGIFPSQPPVYFLLMWDQMFVANPCFPHPSLRFISDRSIAAAAAGWSFKQKIAFFPLKLQHGIVKN